MIKLHPIPEAEFHCPHDNQQLQVTGWYIPGMRNLADLRCPECGREYYGDLQAGHGLYYPQLLDKSTGVVHDPAIPKWFASWLHDSFANRSNTPLDFCEEKFRPIKRPLLLNCLDTLYGHSLLKLLNAQYYIDHRSDLDLIVLVPKILRWMVPEGVAVIWTVDLPIKRGIEWNDWLGAELHRRLESYTECWLSVAYSHPHPKFFSIERFTHVHPFPIEEWYERFEKPTVTFIWREDRHWVSDDIWLPYHQLLRKSWLNNFLQRRKVVSLATRLHRIFPRLDFAVVGLGRSGGMPGLINDLRTPKIDDVVEKAWCERYASSHVVIGVHGSNMLLPSAHAGATIELIPLDRWGNMIQDLLLPDLKGRETLFRYRIIPLSTSASELGIIVQSLLKHYGFMMLNMDNKNLSHDSSIFLSLKNGWLSLYHFVYKGDE